MYLVGGGGTHTYSELLPVLLWNPQMKFLGDQNLSQTTQCGAVPLGHYLTLNYYYDYV